MSAPPTTGQVRGLPPEAYQEIPGEDYPPYVDASESPPEITPRSITLGALFGILFGAANAYLGLRVGLTISTSIPVAVLTVLAFAFWRGRRDGQSRILEANMSQTIGSASSSVASGIIFTLPALFLWGMVPGLAKMTAIALAGGLLGVLFMVPLRRFLMRGEHGRLPYPEGTACAEVLVASEVGGAKAREVFFGIGVGALYRLLQGAMNLWRGEVSTRIPLLPKAELGLETSPALLGVGYILGPRIAAVMVGGGLLAWLVIIPTIAWLGQDWTRPLYPEMEQLVRDMAPARIWTRYVRYLGAGAVAMGGLITLVRALPMMVGAFRIGLAQIRESLSGATPGQDAKIRTDADLPLSATLAGVGLVVALLALVPHVLGFLETASLRVVAAILVALFAFFFVTVSSRIVGMVGVTSNPTSGMTIATLLGVTGLFLVLGWTDATGQAAALTVGAVVAVAASIAGDTSQDLKTGFLLGATPRRQQLGELFGILTSAFFVCLTVTVLAEAYGFGTPELPAPQATLMKLVVEGVLSQNLPWVLVGIGAAIALAAELVGIPSLAFAVGIYLPVSTMTPVFIGGLVRWLAERGAGSEERVRERREGGVLFGSGLVGGEGLLGVAIAAYAVARTRAPEGFGSGWAGPFEPWFPLVPFAVLVWLLWRATRAGAHG
ncbi:MAG TPA: oligopeptide transporter, OPT family [Vicinamibacteria bacterium]|nr:oligopeptide transporter, OPT family [Vicinamibacteria bacterium]